MLIGKVQANCDVANAVCQCLQPVEGLGAIGWVGMICLGLDGDRDDPLLRQPNIVNPAANVRAGRPALPPDGQGGIGGKAQRRQQFCEEPVKIGIARSRR